jgi:hypothetical protein
MNPTCTSKYNKTSAQVRTWISDTERADSEVFTASCAELDVVARVVMYTSLG